MRILVLEHEPDAPPALLGEWAEARGHESVLAAVPRLAIWPDPRAYDAVISLGSDQSVHDSPPSWLGRELELLRRAHEHDVPTLGICFGAQALAKALGGEVGLAPAPQARWCEISSQAPELIFRGPWFCWHSDCFAVPPRARSLAANHVQTVAFAAGRSLGVQFHPEVDGRLARSWIDGGRAKLTDQGIDTDQLDREIAGFAATARRRAFAQFDRIASWWSESGPPTPAPEAM
jgi:GMP synthase-like glutamine amidotransferase